MVAPPLRLSDHRDHCIGKPAAEDEDREKDLGRKDDRCKLGRPQLTDHEHVRGIDRQLRELRADEGHTQIKARTKMRGPRIVALRKHEIFGRSQHEESWLCSGSGQNR
ncbi:hypothetical protein FB009_10827 [Sinorhizobium medicae]|nr:hypothetical protein FB009_10827 [Sinorhizobium medicae]